VKNIEKQKAGFKFGRHRLKVLDELGKVAHGGRKYQHVRVQTHDGLEYLSWRLYNERGRFIKQLLFEPCLAGRISEVTAKAANASAAAS
jgi:hypothetical protein